MTACPAIFLDRDGVINEVVLKEGRPYPPSSLRELRLCQGVSETLATLKEMGFRLIVVTNQPDVARGTTLRSTVEEIHDHLQRTLPLDAIFTSYEDGDHPHRKPNPGMLLEAAETYGLDLTASWMIGDRWKDIEAGRRAGCRTVFINRNYVEKTPDPPAHLTIGELPQFLRHAAKVG